MRLWIWALVLALALLGCDKKKPAGPGGGGSDPGDGPGPGGHKFGCAIAIRPTAAPAGDGGVEFTGESHGQASETAAHRAAEAEACKQAGAPPDCVQDGSYIRLRGAVKQEN